MVLESFEQTYFTDSNFLSNQRNEPDEQSVLIITIYYFD